MNWKEHLTIGKRAFLHTLRLSKKYTLLLMAHSFLSAIVGYIPIYYSAKVIDALITRAPLPTVLFYAAMTVGLVFLVQLLLSWIASAKQAAEMILWRSEDWAYSAKAMQMAYESIEDTDVVSLRYQVRRESQTGYNLWSITFGIGRYTEQLTKIAASAALTLSFFALPAVSLAAKLAILAGLAVSVAVSSFSTARSNNHSLAFMEQSHRMNILMEHFGNYIGNYDAGKDIRLYDMPGFLGDSYFAVYENYTRSSLRLSRKCAFWTVPGTLLNFLLQFLIYGILIAAALGSSISAGDIAKYAACLLLLTDTCTRLTTTLQVSLHNHIYLKRYFRYFDIPNNMYKGSLTVEKRDDNEYFVEFRNVSFRYPRTENYALRNLNLKFKVGEKLAVVGLNGSGKTTFIKLLCRLYDPTEGEILLNGVDIRKYDYDEYMSLFSVVFQDFNIFSFRLGEVVASGKDYDPNKVRRCLIQAGFGDRLAALPDGVDTYLYQNYDKSGIEISGGEAQKIALARALYKDAPFIILDEPTAALDPISEYEVYSHFNTIAGDKTAVYISHRLASCRFCDKIAVFDQGSIVQFGSHESLLADLHGRYHELWNAQAQYYQ